MQQAGKGSATLSMAYAAAEFGNSCLRAMAGEANITECAYVDSHVTDLPYFATKLTLGTDGVKVCSLALLVHTSLDALLPKLPAPASRLCVISM